MNRYYSFVPFKAVEMEFHPTAEEARARVEKEAPAILRGGIEEFLRDDADDQALTLATSWGIVLGGVDFALRQLAAREAPGNPPAPAPQEPVILEPAPAPQEPVILEMETSGIPEAGHSELLEEIKKRLLQNQDFHLPSTLFKNWNGKPLEPGRLVTLQCGAARLTFTPTRSKADTIIITTEKDKWRERALFFCGAPASE